MKKKTILIVDDEKDLREVICLKLEEEFSFNFLEASNPIEALDVFHKNKNSINYVIVDYFMPQDNGLEFCKIIKDTDPKIRVILFTGNIEIRGILQNTKRGLVDFVQIKSDDFEEFINYLKLSEEI